MASSAQKNTQNLFQAEKPRIPARVIYFPDPIRYVDALEIQERLHGQRLRDEIPDTILALQHQPVITLGRRARVNHLIVPQEQLEIRGVDLVTAGRGGDVTWHGPGQVVIYPILKLTAEGSGLHGYLHLLEKTAIQTCIDFGVEAFRRDTMAGAWIKKGKLAAIGFQFRHWVSLHGMSFNVNNTLDGFGLIHGCGLVGEPVATLKMELGDLCPSCETVEKQLIHNFLASSGRVAVSTIEYTGADSI